MFDVSPCRLPSDNVGWPVPTINHQPPERVQNGRVLLETNTTFEVKFWTDVPAFHFSDFATWTASLIGPNWKNLAFPSGTFFFPQGMDMAFSLNTGVPALPPAPMAIILPPPMLYFTTTSDGQISISWHTGGTLQNADNLSGPWINLSDATSPYVAPATKPSSFNRLAR